MKRSFDYIGIVIFVFLVHGLLLFSDGVYWDDWLWSIRLASRDFASVYKAAMEMGIPAYYYFWRSLALFPNVVLGERITVFFLILLMAFLIYGICKETKVIGRIESLMIVAVAISYPAFQTWFIIVTSEYVFHYFVFLLAIYMMLTMEASVGFVKIGLRVLSLSLFFLSFSFNSLLVFYFGSLLIVFVILLKRKSITKVTEQVKFVFSRIDYLVVPFLYWIIKHIYFPQFGIYAEYNPVKLSVATLVFMGMFFINSIYNQIYSAMVLVLTQPVLWLCLLLLGLTALKRLKLHKLLIHDSSVNSRAVLLMGILLLISGIFPYAAAGKYPNFHGWDTRHALLLSIPMGIILVFALVLFFSGPSGRLNWIGWLLFFILILGFTGLTINNYIDWEQRWIKDRSVMARLEKMDDPKKYSIFWIQDDFPRTGGEIYQFYEWPSMFKTIWNDEKWIGLDTKIYSDWFITDRYIYKWTFYNFRRIDQKGCQATLSIIPGPKKLDWKQTFLYQYYRLIKPDEMNNFLEGFTQISIAPHPSVLATHCH